MTFWHSLDHFLMEPFPCWYAILAMLFWYWLGKQHGKGSK